jgi:glycosyltransferase involved in cell wall biosynthesis
MKDAVRRRLDSGSVDAVICDDVYNVQHIPNVRVPVILNKHDITFIILRRYLEHEPSLVRRLYGRLEYWKLRRWEAEACRRLGRVLVVSHLDKAILETLSPSARYAYAPNVIDVNQYPQAPDDDGRTVLYSGAMDWQPNLDAVMFFATQILPRLRQRRPHIQFVVAGRAPELSLRRKLEKLPNVRLTGTVPDMRPEIAKAVVCAVPLRIGSGTRLKILEMGAMEKAIVSTRIGAEGLDLRDGRELILADRPEDFVTAIEALFCDAGRRRALGIAARNTISATYSVQALQAAMRSALTTFLPSSRDSVSLRDYSTAQP